MANKSETETSGFVDNWQSRKSITSCNLHMLTSGDSCDVSFKVGATQSLVRAHNYVLISRSCVFHSMLCGDLASEGDIMIPDVEEKIFREMLKYLYTGGCDVNEVNVIGLLYLARKYAVGGLEDNCVSFLDKKLNAQTACVIMEQAHLFDEKDLQDKALKIILENGDLCLQTDEFKSLCERCFHKIMRSDSLKVKPKAMFSAALLWASHELVRQEREVTPENTRDMLGESIYSITFTSMEQEDFARIVVPSGILTSEETTSLLCHFILPKTDIMPFRVKSKRIKSDQAPLLKFTRINIYDSHEVLKKYVDHTIIEIISEKDIILHGFILSGLVTSSDKMYSVGIRKYRQEYQYDRRRVYVKDHAWTEIESSRTSWDQVKGQPMKSEFHEIKLELPQPYFIMKGIKHCVAVDLLTYVLAEHCGKNMRSSLNVGGCTISLSQIEDNGFISQLLVDLSY